MPGLEWGGEDGLNKQKNKPSPPHYQELWEIQNDKIVRSGRLGKLEGGLLWTRP